jgi:preprotein translocase subunit SecA
MTGTADTEAEEFHKIYKLGVTLIPTNKPMIRKDQSDLVYKNEKGKFRAVLTELEDCYQRGQPVLVGTVSVEKSEVLSQLLRKKDIPHNVLNAKFHEREAGVVAQAGRKSAITISTNMAGRGTDIILGGNPEFMARAEMTADADPEAFAQVLARYKDQCAAEREEVLKAGGLHILGTERHESRRIDNQLRGRSGRQGDPGSSRFYLSLEDDLLRIFGAERITGLMERLGMEEDVPIEHPWVNRAIENAQRKVEGHNFDIRKNLLEYDDVMNQQRKTVYALRRQILEGRYAPELSEAERKEGKTPVVPTTSGDWTIESLEKQLQPVVERMVDRFFAPPADGPFREGAVPDAAPPPPARTWRQLRAEVWRQYGALCDVERLFDGDRTKLIQAILSTVAASLIQQRERLYDLSDQLIGNAVDQCCPQNRHSDDWDFEKLQASLSEQFNSKIDVNRKAQDTSEIATPVWDQVEALLKKREAELSTPYFMYFARHFFLEEIDNQWIDHLKAMDHLREGIGLRGYGQKDPKQEYKKEGFDLFGEMMGTIHTNVGQKVYRVQIVKEEEELPEFRHKQRKMVAIHPGEGSAGQAQNTNAAASGDEPQKQTTVRRAEPKVGRNDPCPCGSGKKYKKCHGAAEAA